MHETCRIMALVKARKPWRYVHTSIANHSIVQSNNHARSDVNDLTNSSNHVQSNQDIPQLPRTQEISQRQCHDATNDRLMPESSRFPQVNRPLCQSECHQNNDSDVKFYTLQSHPIKQCFSYELQCPINIIMKYDDDTDGEKWWFEASRNTSYEGAISRGFRYINVNASYEGEFAGVCKYQR